MNETHKPSSDAGANREGAMIVDVLTGAVSGVCTLVWREECRGDEVQAVRARLSRRFPYPGFILVVRDR